MISKLLEVYGRNYIDWNRLRHLIKSSLISILSRPRTHIDDLVENASNMLIEMLTIFRFKSSYIFADLLDYVLPTNSQQVRINAFRHRRAAHRKRFPANPTQDTKSLPMAANPGLANFLAGFTAPIYSIFYSLSPFA